MAIWDSTADRPIPEGQLRDIARDITSIFPNFVNQEPDLGVKGLYDVVDPLLYTAGLPNLTPSHRAAACNLLCAIIERCQVLDSQYLHEAVLSDRIWPKLLTIYLDRSDSAKGKSVRQVLLTLTGILLRCQSPRSLDWQEKATATFVHIICQRQDRLKVKPALQGLAYFIQKDIATIPQLVDIYSKSSNDFSNNFTKGATTQSLLEVLLSWVVHHDTSLSAGHLIRNFLAQLRRTSHQDPSGTSQSAAAIWVVPVVECLRAWPERIQEFKTHVFPHCFLPNIEEYLYFLSYLNLARHVDLKDSLPCLLPELDTKDNGLGNMEEFRMLLASIETGKELGVVRDVDYRLCKTIAVEDGAILLPDDIFGSWLSHMEGGVRLAGLFLSVHSTAVTRPITGGVFKSLKRNLVHLHTDIDVNFRRELIGYIQRLFDRLRGSTATLVKTKTKKSSENSIRLPFPDICFNRTKKPSHQDPLSESLQFITWYISFIEGEIRPDASYQRRITALRALLIILKSGVDPRVPRKFLSKAAQGQLHWVHGLQISNIKLIRKLLDMILDPFDDVRDISVLLLQICLGALPEEQSLVAIGQLPAFIERAEATLLRTGRADHADGLARSYSLYYYSALNSQDCTPRGPQEVTKLDILNQLTKQLNLTLEVAQKSLSEAVNGQPVHGIFAAIRYILDQDEFYEHVYMMDGAAFKLLHDIHDQVLIGFETLWLCVKDVLCADAPEGHVPKDLEEDDSPDTKEILSYAWRGLKEASTLLRVIVSRAPIGSQERALVGAELFEAFGRLCFTQLIELRHRGAFSTVAQTFAAFCKRCVVVNETRLRSLPENWYYETLLSIQAKAHAITRRSGGIPALMSGIITAESQSGGRLFTRAMQDLIAEASKNAENSNIEESRLPQVHALNCVKEFFMTSKLSMPSEAYIGEGLSLASRTLSSKIWPIRNCSLMLFKALIERLLGSDEAQDWEERESTKTSRFSYQNYPALTGILRSLLDPQGPLKKSMNMPNSDSPMDLHGAEGVFPALQILRQAMPPEDSRLLILNSVTELLSSPHWHLRDMAARTIAALYRPHELLAGSKWLLNNFEESHNARHGKLLCVKYCLRKGLQSTLDNDQEFLRNIMLHLSVCMNTWYNETSCPFVKAAFLDLVSLCGLAIITSPGHKITLDLWHALTAQIFIGANQDFYDNCTITNSLLHQSLARVFFIDRVVVRPEHIYAIISDEYRSMDKVLLLLAARAPDTCLVALDTLNDVVQAKVPRGPVLQISLILLDIYHLVRDVQGVEVLSKAQTVLADGLCQHPTMVDSVLSLISENDILFTLSKLEAECLEGTPSNAESALYLLAFFLDWAYHRYPLHRRSMLYRIARYIRLLRMTLVETSPFDARFAAVQSVSAISQIWTMSPTSKSTGPLLLGLTLVLYDMLNDDDDEVRDLAALATASLISFHSEPRSLPKPSVPVLSSHRLASFLITHFTFSSDLQTSALRRLTGTPLQTPLFAVPFVQLLVEYRREDTALFSTEKQNLFLDPTLDAVLWSRVLRASSAHAMPGHVHAQLQAWVIAGLRELIQVAENERDGPLGWTSKPEVFTLGMRVICAADVALRRGDRAVTQDGVQLRKLLGRFVEVGRDVGETHGLWVATAEKVLENSIIQVVRRVREGLVAMQMGLPH